MFELPLIFFLWQTYNPEMPADATRNLSQQCLNSLANVLPGLLGGSADLASSNMTLLKMFVIFKNTLPQDVTYDLVYVNMEWEQSATGFLTT